MSRLSALLLEAIGGADFKIGGFSKSDFQKALRKGKSEVLRAAEAEDIPKARKAWERLSDALRPLGYALDNVKIERREEQRKLKNLRGYFTRIKKRTAPGYHAEWEKELPLSGMVFEMDMEAIEEAVNFILKRWGLIASYAQTEESFKHGPFTVWNRYGFRKDEYNDAIKVLDDAAAAIRKAGFGDLLYGNVMLVARRSKQWSYAGRYNKDSDTIELNVESGYRFNAVYTVIHEFGHRHWHKLTAAQRDRYEDLYAATAGGFGVPLEDREKMWDAWEKSGYDLRRATQMLDKRLSDLLRARIKEMRSGSAAFKPEPKIGITKEVVRRQVVVPNKRYIYIGGAPSSVTDYGAGSVTEDYPEVFAHFVTGKPMDDAARQRFASANPRVAA